MLWWYGICLLSFSSMGFADLESPPGTPREELRGLIASFKESMVPERLKAGGDPYYDCLEWNFRTGSWLFSSNYGYDENIVVFLDTPGYANEVMVTAVTERGASTYRLPGSVRRGGTFAIDVKAAGRVELCLQSLDEKDASGKPIYYLSAGCGNIEEVGKLAVHYPIELNRMGIDRVRYAIAQMNEQSHGGLRLHSQYRLPGYIPSNIHP